MTKKPLAILTASLLILPTAFTTVSAKQNEDLPIGYYNIAEPYRYVTFATDGGSFIKALEKPIGEKVNLDSYIPQKDGYIFDGWYSDPRTKIERISEIILNENIVVYAKWIDNGIVKDTDEMNFMRSVTDNAVTFTNADASISVPVTSLWVNRNTRLEYLMSIYNKKFHN